MWGIQGLGLQMSNYRLKIRGFTVKDKKDLGLLL